MLRFLVSDLFTVGRSAHFNFLLFVVAFANYLSRVCLDLVCHYYVQVLLSSLNTISAGMSHMSQKPLSKCIIFYKVYTLLHYFIAPTQLFGCHSRQIGVPRDKEVRKHPQYNTVSALLQALFNGDFKGHLPSSSSSSLGRVSMSSHPRSMHHSSTCCLDIPVSK